ncbi:Mob1/phocein [Dothidotthia symphoricarpi CBS 119687]|uniref:Mob1/phocein n=1 Tax=Dothidotthia symphoricarpi CBS 119687 TaxID=1392245 RepID=A0A6A6A2L0_9PLEO|nr:Mob1/phocein [Dothidotthia symphoricarpi CBS 119687]KAF2125137.1 Mob1/phocein [Dothidotthia symphoricarpi CBS 119687]
MATPASPRLPSPPPIAEDQLSPAVSSEQQKLFSNLDHGAARRIRPGTRAEDMAEGPPLVELTEIDSAFQLTEHLKALHNFLTHPIGSNGMIPVDKDMALKLAHPPDNVDRTLWLYELCRFLIQKVNSIIVALFSDSTPCSSLTCPEMRASEWQYLCAVHDPPKSCCAIDYCCHTLDWAANTLTSPKHFPSRLALGTDQSTQHSQTRQLTNIFRRVYRIFAHAWFQHRDMFWKVEGRTGLYIFYKTVCDFYGLIPDDNYTVPAEAEGIEHPLESRSAPPLILKREPSEPGPQDLDNVTVIEDNSLSTAGTTKRHRHSPSVGAMSVTTVVEEAEEEEEQPKAQSRPVTQIFESLPDDFETIESDEADTDAELAEEPVSVDDEPEKQSTSDDEADAQPQGEKEDDEEPVTDKASGIEAEASDASEGSTEAANDPVIKEEKDTSEDTDPAVEKADEDEKSAE